VAAAVALVTGLGGLGGATAAPKPRGGGGSGGGGGGASSWAAPFTVSPAASCDPHGVTDCAGGSSDGTLYARKTAARADVDNPPPPEIAAGVVLADHYGGTTAEERYTATVDVGDVAASGDAQVWLLPRIVAAPSGCYCFAGGGLQLAGPGVTPVAGTVTVPFDVHEGPYSAPVMPAGDYVVAFDLVAAVPGTHSFLWTPCGYYFCGWRDAWVGAGTAEATVKVTGVRQT
jgi:hypothetical protein